MKQSLILLIILLLTTTFAAKSLLRKQAEIAPVEPEFNEEDFEEDFEEAPVHDDDMDIGADVEPVFDEDDMYMEEDVEPVVDEDDMDMTDEEFTARMEKEDAEFKKEFPDYHGEDEEEHDGEDEEEHDGEDEEEHDYHGEDEEEHDGEEEEEHEDREHENFEDNFDFDMTPEEFDAMMKKEASEFKQEMQSDDKLDFDFAAFEKKIDVAAEKVVKPEQKKALIEAKEAVQKVSKKVEKKAAKKAAKKAFLKEPRSKKTIKHKFCSKDLKKN